MRSHGSNEPDAGSRSSEAASPAWLTDRTSWAIVIALTLVGLIPRLIHLDGSYVGDEVSTLYLVHGRGLSDVLTSVSSDAEISPPLYFLAGWAFSQLGDWPELVRMPSLLAGIAVVPLTYMVGVRMLTRPAALIAAAAMALNPFVVFYATDARAYMLAMALLLATTLTMLIALEDGRRRWWVAYAVFTALCMYTHYTTAFVLGAQLLWLLWFHPPARVTAIVANIGAAILFIPWIPSMLADMDSPTIDVLSALQGDGFDVKRAAVENWAFGYPYNLPVDLPGRFLVTLGTVALVVAAVVGLWRWAGPRLRRRAEGFPPLSRGVILALLLALATPVAELVILGLGGTDLFGARNLNTSAPGFALSIGALTSAAGMAVGAICAAAVLGVFAFTTARSLDPSVSTIKMRDAARYIEAESDPDDVVLDIISAALSPVPLTSLDVYLPQPRVAEFRPYLPEGPPPFVKFPPPPRPIVEEAIREADGKRLFIVSSTDLIDETADPLTITLPPAEPGRDETETVTLPPAWEVVDRRDWEGISGVEVLVLEQTGGGAD
jgi:hypothetical protein